MSGTWMTLPTSKASGLFTYRGLSFFNKDAAFKISTDSLLLADWADTSDSKKILDVGCGTGVIGLLIAARSIKSEITLIEKDYDSYIEATQNAINNSLACRTSIIFGKFQMIGGSKPYYDHIVCNPPYFTDAKLGPDSRKNDTRHAISLPLAELFRLSWTISLPNAKLSLIYPFQQKNELESCDKSNWKISRESKVVGKSGMPALILMEFQKKERTIVKSRIDLRK